MPSSVASSAGERLTHLYVQPADAAGATVELDYIRFVPKSAVYAATPHGLEEETIGNELRPVLYMRPDQELQFPVAVPADQPRLDFGMGALLTGAPLRFEVLVQRGADGTVTTAHDATIAQAARWRRRPRRSHPLGRPAGAAHLAGDRGRRAGQCGVLVEPDRLLAPAKPFNVIFMIEDAERADHLSVYGHPAPTTPFKRRLLAERGVVFEQAIAQADKTRPSAASFMTAPLPDRHRPLAFLRYPERAPSDAGRGHARAGLRHGLVHPERQCRAVCGPASGLRPGDRRGDDRLDNAGGVHRGGGAAVLEGHRDRNFFLYLHAIDPHALYDPPEPYRSAFVRRDRLDSTPVERDAEFDAPWVENRPWRAVAAITTPRSPITTLVVERILCQLDELGLAQNTLVVMTADHGEYLGERGLFGDRLWSHNPPGFLLGTRVPLMLVYPARFAEPSGCASGCSSST